MRGQSSKSNKEEKEITMRKDNNWILNELVKHEAKPTRLRNYRYTYNRQQLLEDYVDAQYNYCDKAHEVTERFHKFKGFIRACGGIKGTTDGGRRFTLEFNDEAVTSYSRYGTTNEPYPRWLVKIYDKDNCVYEPSTDISDVMNYSILSAVNKYETNFWDGYRKPNKVERSILRTSGEYDSLPFEVRIDVKAGEITGTWKYDNDVKTLYLNPDVPGHIPHEQHHKYKTRLLAQPAILREKLKDTVKSNYMRCCGYQVSHEDKFCSRCGREFTIEELILGEITVSHLETLLR